MSYTSIIFAFFIVAVTFAYFITPLKFRWLVLLIASYAFYYLSSGLGLMVYLFTTTISIFSLAIIIEKFELKAKKTIKETEGLDKEGKRKIRNAAKSKKRVCVLIGLLLNLGILAYFKYLNFIIVNIDALFNFDIEPTTLLVPLGISFYTFQSTGYLIDVYRGKFEADRNLAKFALFTSFFPQIVQGPISRYDQLAHQLYEGHRFDYTRVKHGVQLIIWGCFQKLIIADRAFVLANYMLDNYTEYKGFEVLIGMFAIAIRSYTDFSGGIDISRGVAQILGIDMVKNFRQPYFATSIRDYWSRWHVTLGQWFRDYFYYSLLFSKGWRSFINWSQDHLGKYFGKIFPVAIGMAFTFFLVGIWHGAAWKYMLFGVFNGTLVLIGILMMPILKTLNDKYNLVKIEALSWRILLSIGVFCIICTSKLITGANGVNQSFTLFKAIFAEFNPWIFLDGSMFELGLDQAQFTVFIFGVIVLFFADLLREMGLSLRESLDKQNTYFRWIITFGGIILVVIFGVYGSSEVPDFIYQQF